jgi:hypothetical protein
MPERLLGLASPLTAIALCGAWTGCASAGAPKPESIVLSEADAAHDLRLRHPPNDAIPEGAFDVEHVELGLAGEKLVAVVTFRSPVNVLRYVRVRYRDVGPVFPQTVDIYLDTTPGAGHTEALADRGFYVPTSEAWDKVLVLTSLPAVDHEDAVFPQALYSDGRKLVGIFRASDVPGTILGALVTVSATSPVGSGRIRLVTPWLGDCLVWEDLRCTLEGEGPAVIDVVGTLRDTRIAQLTYLDGSRPRGDEVPVVFQRGKMVGAAPVSADLIAEGTLATLLNGEGDALATAVVVSVAGDTASLEIVSGALQGEATSVVFGEKKP